MKPIKKAIATAGMLLSLSSVAIAAPEKPNILIIWVTI